MRKKTIDDRRKWIMNLAAGRADLRRADLSGADLSDVNLRGADLRRADLSQADLSRANLRDADLRDADLRDADLSYANLSGADLSGAENIFHIGFDRRGWVLVSWLKGAEIWFNAGDKSFSKNDALKHWNDENYPPDPQRGQMYVKAVTFLADLWELKSRPIRIIRIMK